MPQNWRREWEIVLEPGRRDAEPFADPTRRHRFDVGPGPNRLQPVVAGGRRRSGRTGAARRSRRLERDEFDMVAVGRALLQDPEWVTKVREGRTDELKSFERSAMGVLY